MSVCNIKLAAKASLAISRQYMHMNINRVTNYGLLRCYVGNQ